MSNNFRKSAEVQQNMDNRIGLLIAALGAIWVLKNIANNPKVSPNVRFISRFVEGDLYQDLESGEFFYA